MAMTLAYKILSNHIKDGQLQPDEPIGIRIDQTLTQDATGTTAFLLYESAGGGMVNTDLSVSYIDHNMSQFGPENHNDHLYLQTVAAKSGVYLSRAGNGICHQVHLERFGKPGSTLLGSDSHTPTGGGIAQIAIGAGGMDVSVAMSGGLFYLTCPKVYGIKLTGKLQNWASAKDIILKLLSLLSTKGNVGWIAEYFGPAVKDLSVPQRATITNMGAELGVTTSLFPSDEQTEKFLTAQNRANDYKPLAADADAVYDRVIEIDLDSLEPLASCPSSPDNIQTIKSLAGKIVNQVLIGSCTNSSYADLMMVAAVLKGRTINSMVELGIAPGSGQVLNMLAANGALGDMISAGARILESGCGPCIGQGFSPANDTVSLRTFNRNFAGRTGTVGDQAYLVSPETAVASALTGKITEPKTLGKLFSISCPKIELPNQFLINDKMIIKPLPEAEAKQVTVLRGPTIVVPEAPASLAENISGEMLLKCGDKITTDHIMPAGVYLKLRSNVPEYAKVVFDCFSEPDKPSFADRALALKAKQTAGVIVAGESYGQGSSREHAALCPMYLGIRAVIAKSIERIHKANLINFCIVPIEFDDMADYDKLNANDKIVIKNIKDAVKDKNKVTIAINDQYKIIGKLNLSERDRAILLASGLLNYAKGNL